MVQGFLSELKRRNVFRVALGYSAAAWAVLEVADLVFPIIGLPNWAMRLVLLISALGFPIALACAWAFDLTPQGVVRAEEETRRPPARIPPLQWMQFVLIGLLVLLVGYLYYQQLSTAEGQVPEPLLSQPSNTISAESIAVLPFVDMSPGGDSEYFSDGISEELLNALANVKGLRVAARTSSFYFKNSNQDVTEIGRKLGVAALLEGSVRKAGDQVRITAQLINADTGYHLWSETYDGVMTDIFELQDRIARQVVRSILPMLLTRGQLPDDPEEPTDNPAAYDAYLKGLSLLRQPISDQSLADARDQFDRAIALDPDFASAYAGLCETLLARYSHHREPAAFNEAEQVCHRALTRGGEQFSHSWQLHISLGILYREAGQWEQSEKELSLAGAMRPASVRPLQELGLTYEAWGKAGEAEAALQEALTIEPGNWDSHLILGNFYLDQGDFDKARQHFREVLALEPGYASALIGMGNTLYMENRGEDARDYWLQARAASEDKDTGSLVISLTNLGVYYYYQGDFQAAAEVQSQAAALRPEYHIIWGQLAESYRGMGDSSQERESYLRAVELAEQEVRRNPNYWKTYGLLGVYHAWLNNIQQALDYESRMWELGTDMPLALYYSTLIHWALGDVERAFEQMEAALGQGFASDMIASDPDLANLRKLNPERFDTLLARAAD